MLINIERAISKFGLLNIAYEFFHIIRLKYRWFLTFFKFDLNIKTCLRINDIFTLNLPYRCDLCRKLFLPFYEEY